MRSSIQTINGFSEIGKLHSFSDRIFRNYNPVLIDIIIFCMFLSVGSVSETLCCVKGIPTKNAENFTPAGFGRRFLLLPLDELRRFRWESGAERKAKPSTAHARE